MPLHLSHEFQFLKCTISLMVNGMDSADDLLERSGFHFHIPIALASGVKTCSQFTGSTGHISVGIPPPYPSLNIQIHSPRIFSHAKVASHSWYLDMYGLTFLKSSYSGPRSIASSPKNTSNSERARFFAIAPTAMFTHACWAIASFIDPPPASS